MSFPGAAGTRGFSINDNGVMVGDYAHPNNAGDGFILGNGVFTTFNNPKATGLTSPSDINNAGTIVGDYVIGVLPRSFIYINGVFKDINVPNANPYAQAHGVNDYNRITGQVFNSDGSSGFIAHCQ